MTGPIHERDRPWHEPPGHHGGLSRYLVNPEDDGAQLLDFRLSRYPPGGLVAEHVHAVAEHAYYVLEGSGRVTLGDTAHEVGAGSVVFVAPGVRHSVVATGSHDLVFVVSTAPASDIER
jgi:quercetin dioxygenase-like cupin family protein